MWGTDNAYAIICIYLCAYICIYIQNHDHGPSNHDNLKSKGYAIKFIWNKPYSVGTDF